MKKLFVLLLTALLATSSLYACGDSEGAASQDASATTSEEVKEAVVDVKALKEQVKTLTAAKDTTVRSDDDVYNDVGIDPATYSEGFWLIDSTITVETVAFFKANDAASAEAIKGLIDKYVKSVLNQQNNYNEENYYMAEKAKVGISGNYVYMVMSPNVDSVYAAIDAALKG